MQTLVIDRSTRTTSIVLAEEDGSSQPFHLGIWDDDSASSGVALPTSGKYRIVVGTGPGSFAGIRSTIAFAQGCRIGAGVEVFGLTSAAAFARENENIAAVGDARRGLAWIGLFEGYNLTREIFQVPMKDLISHIPASSRIVSPDRERIGEHLTSLFADRYDAKATLDAANLAKAFTANPALLCEEPLPIYLNPAVR